MSDENESQNENFNDPNMLRFAPRFDLREKAFRNYESYIARAYREGSYTLDPKRERLKNDRRSISARSFCIRFRDAILGYTRFSYTSDLIPAGKSLMHIKAKELLNGMVRIINLQKDNTRRAGAFLADSDWDKVLLAIDKMREIHLKDAWADAGEVLVYFNTPEEEARIKALYDSHSVLPNIVEPGLYSIHI